jgi:hypothetical protein
MLSKRMARLAAGEPASLPRPITSERATPIFPVISYAGGIVVDDRAVGRAGVGDVRWGHVHSTA